MNIFTERRRVINILISVVSCSALVVLGITYAYNTNVSISRQYSDYFLFDYVITYNSNNIDSANEIKKILSNNGITYTQGLCVNLRSTLPNGTVNSPCMIVTETKEDLDKLFHLKHLNNNNKSENYVSSEEFLERYFGVGEGDTYEVTTLAGKDIDLPIDNVFVEYTIPDYFILDKVAYEKHFGTEYHPERFFINLGDCNITTLTNQLNNIEGFKAIVNQKEDAINGFAIISSLSDALAVLYVLLSIIMALMVLVNHINASILEKKNEMRILLVNGASNKQAKKYVVIDTLILTAIGVLIGCVLGTIFGNLSITGLEGGAFMLVHDICLLALAGGVLITAALSYTITIILLRKVKL